jgi:hypothetical protein
LLHTVANLNKQFDYLNNRIDERAQKWELEYIDREAKEMREHINAIEKHLNITLVKEPARIVVKAGESK